MKHDPLELATNIIEAFQMVKELMETAQGELDYRDQEYNDLTHALELINFNAVEGYKLAKQMQDNRTRRRQAKNMLELVQPLYDLMNKNQGFLRELKNVHATIERTKGKQIKRVYVPRVRTDLLPANVENGAKLVSGEVKR